MLLHYLAFLDYSYVFFLISDVNTEAENEAKMATFLSEIFTLVSKTIASQPNTQMEYFAKNRNWRKIQTTSRLFSRRNHSAV